MKKALIPVIMICYLAFSSGVMVNLHYCMNRLASTELFAIASEQCGKCGMDMHKAHGCCRDELKIVKMDDDQKVNPAVSFALPTLDQLVIVPSEFIITSFYNTPEDNHYSEHPPPLLTEQDTYIQNCVFRI
jgi:hypothetical protein